MSELAFNTGMLTFFLCAPLLLQTMWRKVSTYPRSHAHTSRASECAWPPGQEPQECGDAGHTVAGVSESSKWLSTGKDAILPHGRSGRPGLQPALVDRLLM